MKLLLILSILIITNSIHSLSQEVRIKKHLKEFQNSAVYLCKDSTEMFGDVSTMRLKKDSFIVVNQFNSGFGGKKIEIIISNKLKITKIDYYMSYDVVISGEEITYSVEKPSVELNIN